MGFRHTGLGGPAMPSSGPCGACSPETRRPRQERRRRLQADPAVQASCLSCYPANSVCAPHGIESVRCADILSTMACLTRALRQTDLTASASIQMMNHDEPPIAVPAESKTSTTISIITIYRKPPKPGWLELFRYPVHRCPASANAESARCFGTLSPAVCWIRALR